VTDPLFVVQTTVESRELAERLADGLVEHRLAACVQIAGPLQSVYRWQGKIETSVEWRLSIKTCRGLVDSVETFLKQHHPYDVPEIVATAADHVSGDYQRWLNEQLNSRETPELGEE
jgi:periplasmic divalent cation tolerance protein